MVSKVSEEKRKKKFKLGIDNYGLFPLGLTPMETLTWAVENHAQGVQFSGLSSKDHKQVGDSYLKELADYAADKELYIEWGGAQHIPMDMS